MNYMPNVHIAPSSHSSVLIENTLTSKANKENNLAIGPIATMWSTNLTIQLTRTYPFHSGRII